jgi:transcriptional regulator with XRE-family HTH domain
MGYRTQEQVIEEIVALRERQGVSQRQLADVLGLDQSAVSRIERGERGLAVAELAGIAEHLGASVDAILRDDQEIELLRADTADATVREAMSMVDRITETFFSFEALSGARD